MIDSPWNLMMPAASPTQGATATLKDRKSIEAAAAGFEAVMVREWLRQVRSSTFSEDQDSGASGYLAMGDDQLAHFVSRGGGLGLARQLADQLLKQVHGASLIAPADPAVKHSGMREVSGE